MLSIACPPLDALLEGGLEEDAITLVFGEGGSGKTHFALQCARQAARAGHRVAYVDTEGVSAIRLAQLFADDRTAQERILFFSPFTIDEQERMVQNAIRVPGLGLVVVDSINMHYRLHIDAGGDAEKEARHSLFKQLHALTGFARKDRVPVLVTGQVYGGEDETQPFARRVMEHLVKAVVRFEKRPQAVRRATMVKHRSIPEGRHALFRITSDGLAPADPVPDDAADIHLP